MKININFTVELNADSISHINEYLSEVYDNQETVREYVESFIISGGIGLLEENMSSVTGTWHHVKRVK